MPGKQDEDKLDVAADEAEEVTVTIAGETWELSPLMGLKSMHVVPRLLRIVSKLTFATGQAKIDRQLPRPERVIRMMTEQNRELVRRRFV